MNLVDSVYLNRQMPLNDRDFFNLEYLRDDSWEYATKHTMDSRRTLWSKFYKKPADLYHLKEKYIDLHLSPIMQLSAGPETNTPTNLWLTARGVEVRGTIAGKLGFYSYISDSQGSFSQYVRDYSRELATVNAFAVFDAHNIPGEGLAKILRRTGADYMSGRGYITFNPVKPINIQFGHDRNFIGSGIRSVLLSDFSSPYLFFKMTSQFGRFQYTNLFCSMINKQDQQEYNQPVEKKYAAIHHLSMRLGRNMQVGVFEAEILSRPKTQGFDWNYLNPIIFYRFVESQIGSSDNALLGVDYRWNVFKHIGLYSQFVLDEFRTASYFSGDKDWIKKYAFQAGFKYIDVLGIKNLDFQGEYNVVRPFTYSHKSGYSNYVQYNQPLAHPYGANFYEYLGIIRYQPFARLTFYGTLMRSNRGVDNADKNWGGNILKNYNTRTLDTGNVIGQGVAVTTRYSDFRLSYMAKHNFFIDARLLMRNQTSADKTLNLDTTLMSLGLRLNMSHKNFVF
jgi:hypothetical protein